MNQQIKVAATTIGICSLVAACSKTEHEQMEERAEDRAEERAEETERVVQRSQPEPTRETPTNEPSTNEATAKKGLAADVVSKITAARCAREQTCGNIGPDKTHASVAACESAIGEDWRDELNAYECPGGIVTKEFDECLSEIKNEDCGAPFDKLERIVACRSSDLCKALD